MNRDELTAILKEPYKKGLPCGVEKVAAPGLANIWFVVPPSPPRKMPGQLPARAIANSIRLLDQMPSVTEADELDKVVSYLFLRREAVQSSRMEGTWSTVDHVLTPGEVYDRKEGKSERASVLGYARALEKEFKRTLEQGSKIFTPELACRLHKEVMSKDPQYKGRPGQLRAPGKPGSVVFIGGLRRKEESIYNPTPPKHVARCLKEVLSWMADDELIELGDAGMGMPLPVRMAIGHAHFEAVHPFPDGNGRVGRMLFTLQMACQGKLPLYLSGFIEAQKDEYVRALQKAQKKLQYGPIVEFISEAMIASYQEAKETKSAILELPGQWIKRGEFREDSGAKRTLPHLLTRPIFSVKELQGVLKISSPAAHRAASQLVDAKIVRERTGYGRNRVFAAEEVIELLSRRFGDDPGLALERAHDLLKTAGVNHKAKPGNSRHSTAL